MSAIAVGFDFDHTLGTDDKLERKAFVRIARAYAMRYGQKPNDDRAAVAIDAALSSFRSGRITIDEAVAESFASAFGHVDADAIAGFKNLAVTMASRCVRALPNVARMLAALDAAGVPYAVLTNGWSPLQESKVAVIGARCPILVSESIGARKPSSEAFLQLAGALGVRPENAWFVGDDPGADVVGALAAGMS
ncbi:MAG: HAD family hydrolase, partial [Candidatus Eremiobacteraeota bacterium]|nr:HAD family hydrolase [Candidatus Eremiobacteraeota bacterium]